ncbi:phage holin [Listeria fleischmannii]|uniref:phage holin n=1 Tax=Listeria fleischmannii TaxID=1069827 RepID=UPI00162A60F4|nr:phage holin [Listeria fleischmannii]MBC1420074.1 phage holin [Listeria fleischmannii]
MKKIINGLKRANGATLARSFFLLLAFVNQGLALFHMSPIPLAVNETDVANSLTIILTVSAGIWAWWKNNSFTKAAKQTDEQLKMLKSKAKNGDYK